MHNLKYFLLFAFILFTGCERILTENPVDDGYPPTNPRNFGVYTAFDGLVILLWDKNDESDLKGYNLYRRTDSTEYVKLAFTQEDYYRDDSLNYNTKYYYKLSAIDEQNQESGFTNEVAATPKNYYSPDQPDINYINARNWEGKKSIYIDIIKSYELDIKGYKIFRSTEPGFQADSSNLIAFINANTYEDTFNLITNTIYYYKIEGVDLGNFISKPSVEVNDYISEDPMVIFPLDKSNNIPFQNFLIRTNSKPATYKIVVYNNQYGNVVWEGTKYSELISDTLNINFNYRDILKNHQYYFRVFTFSKDDPDLPNSISKLYSFRVNN